MNWLTGFLGGDPDSPVPHPRSSDPSVRPFDIVSAGLDAWAAKDVGRAESLLREGLEAYRRSDPSDSHFALGRLGAFLLDQRRVDEAASVLEEAIEQGTDIPAIWGDYLEVLAIRREIDRLFATALRSGSHLRGSGPPWELLRAHARRADRDGDVAFADAVLRRVADEARAGGDQDSSWGAIGDLGYVLERADRIDDAVTIWTQAFDEGSRDPTTANRLSMHLERAKDYGRGAEVIQAALSRHLPVRPAPGSRTVSAA